MMGRLFISTRTTVLKSPPIFTTEARGTECLGPLPPSADIVDAVKANFEAYGPKDTLD